MKSIFLRFSGRRPHFFAHTEKFKTLCLCFFWQFCDGFAPGIYFATSKELSALTMDKTHSYWANVLICICQIVEPFFSFYVFEIFGCFFQEYSLNLHSIFTSQAVRRFSFSIPFPLPFPVPSILCPLPVPLCGLFFSYVSEIFRCFFKEKFKTLCLCFSHSFLPVFPLAFVPLQVKNF